MTLGKLDYKLRPWSVAFFVGAHLFAGWTAFLTASNEDVTGFLFSLCILVSSPRNWPISPYKEVWRVD